MGPMKRFQHISVYFFDFWQIGGSTRMLMVAWEFESSGDPNMHATISFF
jgi:hypothetical protein